MEQQQQHHNRPPPQVKNADSYSGIDSALKNLGHTLYSTETIDAELAVQNRITTGNPASRAAFRELVVNIQQVRVYLAMLGGQPYVTMVHTPGVYYSISLATSTYQGKVLAFIGDCRETKETTPVCLPATKTWEWHTGQANTDFPKLEEFYGAEANRGKLWMLNGNDGTTKETKLPNLLAIPNALVDLLQTQGPTITPYDVLAIVNNFIGANGHPGGLQWDCVQKWCLVASQAGTSGKSKVFLDTSPVTIDNKDFDRWVGNRLDIAMGPRPAGGGTGGVAGGAGVAGVAGGNQQTMENLALSKIFSTTIGTNMMQFSQAISPHRGVTIAGGTDTALASSKGFDQDQIAKLKDTCGVFNAHHIPAIWSVIQSTKGKSIDTYRTHIAKAIDSWCCLHHIDRDKCIFLKAKFFEDLVVLRFNPGGPVAQYHSVVQGMSMLACRSLTAVEAEQCWEYEEAAENTKYTQSINDLLKQNRGKPVTPAANYMDLKLNIGTYCGLLWALLGDHCDYYKELLSFTIRNAYTKEVCARITWAIIDDGRSFFGRNPVASDFAPGSNFQFSTSYLEGITDAIQNAIPIQ
jgi:hypothetical protein